jgi:glycosyltransferase involved in cell wall biosynthesis
MGRWLARAAVYASPARYEPFGLSVLEAALAGCALVLGDLPSLRELWNDAAVFVQPGSAAQLRQVLSRVAADDRLREALALRARARALNLSATRMAERYHAAYQYLVSAGRAEGVSPAAA